MQQKEILDNLPRLLFSEMVFIDIGADAVDAPRSKETGILHS